MQSRTAVFEKIDLEKQSCSNEKVKLKKLLLLLLYIASKRELGKNVDSFKLYCMNFSHAQGLKWRSQNNKLKVNNLLNRSKYLHWKRMFS